MSNSPHNSGLAQFKKSLDYFKWDYEIISAKYIAFGSKQVAYYNYMKIHPEVTHLFLTDAHDLFMLGTMHAAIEAIDTYYSDVNILFSSEKGCWPYPDKWLPQYPVSGSMWNYLNGGACFVKASTFIEMFERFPIEHQANDQVDLTEIFLNHRDEFKMGLDTKCEVFQSIAFEEPNDFEYLKGALVNKITNTYPTIIHGNGKTDMSKIYNLL